MAGISLKLGVVNGLNIFYFRSQTERYHSNYLQTTFLNELIFPAFFLKVHIQDSGGEKKGLLRTLI